MRRKDNVSLIYLTKRSYVLEQRYLKKKVYSDNFKGRKNFTSSGGHNITHLPLFKELRRYKPRCKDNTRVDLVRTYEE
jgi:hypothetical protein